MLVLREASRQCFLQPDKYLSFQYVGPDRVDNIFTCPGLVQESRHRTNGKAGCAGTKPLCVIAQERIEVFG